MTTDSSARCALGVTDRTLSDFRSDGLHGKAMERLRAHIAQCPACQARLDEYEALARALRAQPEPDGHARLWRNVRASITAGATPSRAQARQSGRLPGAGRSRSTQFWAAFGSIAAVVALSVGFVALFVSRGGWPPATTTTATPIVIHSGSLTWKQVMVPRGFPSVDQFNASATYQALTVAQSDGNTAYACQANKHKVSSPVVWATHDAGASWSVITPTDIPANTGGCRIVLDASDASSLIVSFFPVLSPQQPATPDRWVTYATFDGGATWTKPAGLQDSNVSYQQATARGKVYATRGTATSDGHVNTALYMSSDQMRTWTQIDATLPETHSNPSQVHDTGKTFQFWVNASTGEVLDLTYPGTLWSTVDDGAHWAKIAYPAGMYSGDPHAPLVMVGSLTNSGFLTICGTFTSLGSESEQWLECTTDDGKTWTRRPLSAPTGHRDPLSIGSDGSIYAISPQRPGHSNASLYRLPPDATSSAGWQWLGEIPDATSGFGCGAFPSESGMVFWTFPSTSTTTDSAGRDITTVQPNYYAATYP